MTQVIPPSGQPPTWSRVKAILADALDLTPHERDVFLDHACAGQPVLRRRLADLVRAYSGSPSLDDADSPARSFTPNFEPQTGSLLGRYRITRLIGRGGMGAVYEAFDDQLARPVAIKLMQAGVASRSMLKRFDLESRLLARLRHPGIAQIFEAGTVAIPGAAEHAPFFAMELINGATPLTTYADVAKLSTEQRLQLFIHVCDAVTHGHQRSVIHRDLKPANILVDASGHPKIIDFGVARATDPGAAATTLAGEVLGTLRYMSPEQIAGNDGEDLDVRTDVYSLGVVLYELLSGQPPHPDTEGGLLASIREAPRRIPAPLSQLSPEVSADLETVALKAVQPDRHVRYQSVAEFAADLGRILRHEPISARPLSAIYQIRMFARRHRALVAGFTLILAALTLGIIGTTIGLVRARDAERAALLHSRRTERIAAFLKNTIRSADPQLLPPATIASLSPDVYPWETWTLPTSGWASAGPAEVGVAGVLRHAAKHLEAEFGDDPLLQAEVSTLLAFTLSSLEDNPTALTLLESALSIQSRLLPAEDESVIRTRTLYGSLLVASVRPRDADVQFRIAGEAARRRFGPLDPRTLNINDNVVKSLAMMEGRFDEAVTLAKDSIRQVAQAKGQDSGAAWLRHLPLIDLLRLRPASADHSELIAESRATLDGLSRTISPDITAVGHVCWCLSTVLEADPATLDEAETLLRRALAIAVKFCGPDSSGVYDRRTALTNILLRQRKLPEAQALAREAFESSLRMFGPRSGYTLKAEGRLARILTWQETGAEEAERLGRHAADLTAFVYGATEDFACYHHAVWAAAVRLRGRPAEAEAMLRDRIALRGTRSVQVSAAWVEAYQYLQLGLCLHDLKRTEEATQAIQTARAWANELQDPLHSILLNVQDVQERFDPAGGR